VLTVVTPDVASIEPESVQLQHFADEVTRLSGGTLTIDIHWYPAPDSAPRLDQHIAEQVINNEADLAMVPARAWDEEGVTTLRALSTPFLITDDRTVAQVLNNDNLRHRPLSGLPSAKVIGIDLWPGHLRHLYAANRPLTSLNDLRGQILRAPRSQVEWSLLRAWGVRPTFGPYDPLKQAGLESSYSYPIAGTATGNITPFPKVSTLVANRSLHQRLTNPQWNLLRQAAALTRTWAFGNLVTDPESAARFCADGGTIVAATPHDIAALKRAAEPVITTLRQDEPTATLIDDIALLTKLVPPPPEITRCPGIPSKDGTGAVTALDGVYTFDVTEAALARLGVSEPRLASNSGHFQFTLDHGRYTADQTADHYVSDPRFYGSYAYDGNVVTFTNDPDGGRWGGTVTRGKHGELTFSKPFDSRGGDDVGITRAWVAHPWQRVGLVRSGHS
jgi:TRAP-type C4-dicarboxylate transport system substrate-binding protein